MSKDARKPVIGKHRDGRKQLTVFAVNSDEIAVTSERCVPSESVPGFLDQSISF